MMCEVNFHQAVGNGPHINQYNLQLFLENSQIFMEVGDLSIINIHTYKLIVNLGHFPQFFFGFNCPCPICISLGHKFRFSISSSLIIFISTRISIWQLN